MTAITFLVIFPTTASGVPRGVPSGLGEGVPKGWGPIPGILHVTDADADTDTDKPDTIRPFFQKRLKKSRECLTYGNVNSKLQARGKNYVILDCLIHKKMLIDDLSKTLFLPINSIE